MGRWALVDRTARAVDRWAQVDPRDPVVLEDQVGLEDQVDQVGLAALETARRAMVAEETARRATTGDRSDHQTTEVVDHQMVEEADMKIV